MDEENIDKTDKIIIEVEKNPIPFDKKEKDYKDAAKKRDVWKHIAQGVGMTAKEVESRWRNVRDGFIKYRKKLKTKSGDGAKTVKEYKYAKVLSFLIPYLGDRPTSGNWEMDDSDEVDDDAQQETLSVIENDASQTGSQPESLQRKCPDTPSISSLSATGKRRKQMPRDDVDTTICEYLKKKIRSPVKIDEKPDDVDLFLQSMAASIRKLPAHQRAAVKYKIHGIVHEAEMQCSFPQMMSPSIVQSTREKPNLSYSEYSVSKPYITSPSSMSSAVMQSVGTSSSTQVFEPACNSSYEYTQYL